MFVVRALLLSVLLACGGGARTATPASVPAAAARSEALEPEPPSCPSAYATYEASWRIALTSDLSETSVDMGPEVIEDIITDQVSTLPNREELAKLRTVHAVVALFLAGAPWPAAFTAADQAIEQCGERAARPSP